MLNETELLYAEPHAVFPINFQSPCCFYPVIASASLLGQKALLSHTLAYVCNQEGQVIQSVPPYSEAHAFRFSFLKSLTIVVGNYFEFSEQSHVDYF